MSYTTCTWTYRSIYCWCWRPITSPWFQFTPSTVSNRRSALLLSALLFSLSWHQPLLILSHCLASFVLACSLAVSWWTSGSGHSIRFSFVREQIRLKGKLSWVEFRYIEVREKEAWREAQWASEFRVATATATVAAAAKRIAQQLHYDHCSSSDCLISSGSLLLSEHSFGSRPAGCFYWTSLFWPSSCCCRRRHLYLLASKFATAGLLYSHSRQYGAGFICARLDFNATI